MMTQQEQPQGHGQPGRQRIARPAGAQVAVIIGFVVLVLAGLALFFIRAGSQPRLAGIDRADASNPALVTAGRQIYLTRCAGCHGANGEGAPGWQRGVDNPLLAPPVDARGPSPQRSDAWLFAVIQQGGQAVAQPGTTSGMPGYGASLSDSEIWALISSIKSTWPAQLQTAQPAR